MDAQTLTKYLAIPTSFLCGGYQLAHSQNILPTLYTLPASISTPIFTQVYYSGFRVILPGALLTAATYGYAAYQTPQSGEGVFSRRNLMIFGAICALGVGAWTKVVMGEGIERLIEIGGSSEAVQGKAEGSGEVLRLLKAWTGQNYVRTGLWVGAGMAGVLAVME